MARRNLFSTLSDVIGVADDEIIKKHVTTGVCTDIVRNEEHEDYPTLAIGTIQFKFIEDLAQNYNFNRASYAIPLDLGMQELPLIGESIIIYRMPNYKAKSEQYFYSRRINLNNTLQYSTYPNIIEVLTSRNRSSDLNSSMQLRRRGGPSVYSEQPIENIGEEKYRQKQNLYPLKNFDGDIIVQNRYGASIRLGSSQMQDALNQKTDPKENKLILGPTNKFNNDALLIFRVGQRQEPNVTLNSNVVTPLSVEDINLDSSCFVMSEKQDINFYFSSNFTTLEELGIIDYTQTIDDGTGNSKTILSNNQAILNSGRIVLNSKENDVILSSERDSIFGSNRNVIADAGSNIYLNPAVGKIFLGTISGDNSVAKYEELRVVLEDILNMIRTLSNTPASPGTPLSPPVAAKVSSTLLKIFDIESNLVKIRD